MLGTPWGPGLRSPGFGDPMGPVQGLETDPVGTPLLGTLLGLSPGSPGCEDPMGTRSKPTQVSGLHDLGPLEVGDPMGTRSRDTRA